MPDVPQSSVLLHRKDERAEERPRAARRHKAGVAAFGLIGLFVGPVIMAAHLAMWREWIFRPASQT
ncbi:hypothetical protein FDV58_33695 [Bradyrhizobium elkanii]|uniref:Uncharacterized protein n=2 Tax=Bradyrhizobium elkanii TaxID=29448 RepID=A0A4U6RI77_BRAEL|nr:hypothetical protein FDV58_33695 [Bradyrhizobium elkanii]